MIQFDTANTLSNHSLSSAQSQGTTSGADFAALLAEQTTKSAGQVDTLLEQRGTTTDHSRLKEPDDAVKPDLQEELHKLVSMTPAELIRFQMLRDMNLTEDSLKALPFEERMKVEALIKEAIEQQIAGKSGDAAIEGVLAQA
ncbi:MAG: hypothetical protein ACPG4U_04500 [Pseudomonadales bacterium]